MIASKHIGAIAAISMCICLLLCGLIVYGANSSDVKNIPEYEKRMFGDRIITIDIMTGNGPLQEFLDNAPSEEWMPCDLIINGERFGAVGIKVKDYGLKFKFNKYIKGQTYYGLDAFCVYDMSKDVTYMRDYLATDIMDFMEVTTPLVNYAMVAVNGDYYGFGIAVERYEKAFLGRAYNTATGEFHIAGAWIKNYTAADFEEYVEVDEALRYLAAQTVISNLDSYAESMPQNYYVYEHDGKINILPWDYGLAFSGLYSQRASNFVSFPSDAAPIGARLEGGPLLSKLLEIDEYRGKYHGYMKQIVEGYFESGLYESKIRELDARIKNYFENGFPAPCTYEQYKDSLAKLIKLGYQRAESIRWHLDKAVNAGLSREAHAYNLSADLHATRGSAVSALYNMAGRPCVCDLTNPFDDVSPGALYEDAVTWAEAVGIVRGVGDGKFAPEEPVSEQDLAVILDNFAGYMNISISQYYDGL